MHTALDCIPCLARQALEAARFVTTDQAVHERLVREVLLATAAMDFGQSPVVMAQQIHRTLRGTAGVEEPYRAVKDRFNGMALSMLPQLEAELAKAADPLALALRLAIAGNVIDLGVNGDLTEADVRAGILGVLDEPFRGDTETFRDAVKEARSILYLADNAGEIIFDRLLIEQLPTDRVVVAVRLRLRPINQPMAENAPEDQRRQHHIEFMLARDPAVFFEMQRSTLAHLPPSAQIRESVPVIAAERR